MEKRKKKHKTKYAKGLPSYDDSSSFALRLPSLVHSCVLNNQHAFCFSDHERKKAPESNVVSRNLAWEYIGFRSVGERHAKFGGVL